MILKTAKATGYRAVQDDARVAGYLAGDPTQPRTFLKEQMADLDLSQLTWLVDFYAAQEQSSQMMLELADVTALWRDSVYMNRSRRWLYTRGYQSRARRNYEMLVAYMNENPTHDNKGLIKANPVALSDVTLEDTLDLVPGRTKLQRVGDTIAAGDPKTI